MATAINSGEFSMKKTKSPRACVLAIFASAMLCVPGELTAAPDTAGQRAGEVSRIIPAVSIARGAKTISASARTVVDSQDVVKTQARARGRGAFGSRTHFRCVFELANKGGKARRWSAAVGAGIAEGKNPAASEKNSQPRW